MKEKNILQVKGVTPRESLNDIKFYGLHIDFIDKKNKPVHFNCSAWNKPIYTKKSLKYSKEVYILFDTEFKIGCNEKFTYPLLDEFYNLKYTKENILKVVNHYSKIHYDLLKIN